MNLQNYFNKNVRIAFHDGEELVGFVETYTPSADSEQNVEEISIRKDKRDSFLIGIEETEIKEINIIE